MLLKIYKPDNFCNETPRSTNSHPIQPYPLRLFTPGYLQSIRHDTEETKTMIPKIQMHIQMHIHDQAVKSHQYRYLNVSA